jgi:hypothetical protein
MLDEMRSLRGDVAVVEVDEDHRGFGDAGRFGAAAPRRRRGNHGAGHAEPDSGRGAAGKSGRQAFVDGDRLALRRLLRHALLGEEADVDEAGEAVEHHLREAVDGRGVDRRLGLDPLRAVHRPNSRSASKASTSPIR